MTPNEKQVWIGTAHVQQTFRNGVLGDADEAFVNVLGLVGNKTEFRHQVKTAVEDLGLKLLRLKEAETLKERLAKHSVHREILKLARRVERAGRIEFDVFAAFDDGT